LIFFASSEIFQQAATFWEMNHQEISCVLVDRHLTSMEVGWSMNHFTYRLAIKRLVKMAASHKWNFSPLDP
jgi:hypothetical protein